MKKFLGFSGICGMFLLIGLLLYHTQAQALQFFKVRPPPLGGWTFPDMVYDPATGNVGIGTDGNFAPRAKLDVCHPDNQDSYILLDPDIWGGGEAVGIIMNEHDNHNRLWISAYDDLYGNLIYTEDPASGGGQGFGIAGGSNMAPFSRFVVNADEMFLGYSILPGTGDPATGGDGLGHLHVRARGYFGQDQPHHHTVQAYGPHGFYNEDPVEPGIIMHNTGGSGNGWTDYMIFAGGGGGGFYQNALTIKPAQTYVAIPQPEPDDQMVLFMGWFDNETLTWDPIKVGINTRPTEHLHVDGNIKKTGTVMFVEDHPQDPTTEIVYVCLEGPEAGTYIRGTAQLINGEAVINLPEHFSFVTNDEGLTVQLTPVGEWLQLYVVEKGAQQFIVREANGKSGRFDYLVQGVRKGYENHQVIRDKK
jgi:hypothetical protein